MFIHIWDGLKCKSIVCLKKQTDMIQSEETNGNHNMQNPLKKLNFKMEILEKKIKNKENLIENV